MSLPRLFGSLLGRSLAITSSFRAAPAILLNQLPSSNRTIVPPPTASNIGGVTVTQVRTFKDKDVLKLRCDGCYFKKVDDRWWVLCNKHQRHKQRQKVLNHKNKWIVTHVTRTGSYLKKHFQYPHHDI